MKQLKITVNGKKYDVTVEEMGATSTSTSAPVSAAPAPAAAPAAAPAPEAAPAPAVAPANADGFKVESPMPGTILDVKVSVGAQVKNGDTLVVLEAMKMENEIKADRDGTITGVFVNKGDSVDSGSALVSIG